MPEVTVEVAGRTYRLGCGEGEEHHLLALAARVDGEAARLGDQLGQLSEGRMMLLSALMLADRLSEAEAAAAAAERRAAEAQKAAQKAAEAQAQSRAAHPGPFDAGREAEISASLEALAARVEALVGRVDGDG